MSATIIDGKAFAATVRAKVADHVTALVNEHGITPGLAVVLVGEDPASQVYVRSKGKMTVEVGMNSVEHKLDVDTSEADLLALIAQLNADDGVDNVRPLAGDLHSHRLDRLSPLHRAAPSPRNVRSRARLDSPAAGEQQRGPQSETTPMPLGAE